MGASHRRGPRSEAARRRRADLPGVAGRARAAVPGGRDRGGRDGRPVRVGRGRRPGGAARGRRPGGDSPADEGRRRDEASHRPRRLEDVSDPRRPRRAGRPRPVGAPPARRGADRRVLRRQRGAALSGAGTAEPGVGRSARLSGDPARGRAGEEPRPRGGVVRRALRPRRAPQRHRGGPRRRRDRRSRRLRRRHVPAGRGLRPGADDVARPGRRLGRRQGRRGLPRRQELRGHLLSAEPGAGRPAHAGDAAGA